MSDTPMLDIARAYTQRGWSVIPVPFKGKNPGFDDWQNTRLKEQDLSSRFNGKPQNIGVLLGTPSSNLVDIDCDSREAVALASHFLPATGLIFGRASKPDSHWEYEADPLIETVKFLDVRSEVVNGKKKQNTIVEIRSTNAQTIFPGSVHASGEPIRFTKGETPAKIEGNVLLAHVSKLAAAALLAKYWPGEGSRHAAELALAGGLIRAGWTVEDVTEFIVAVAETGGGEIGKQTRERCAEYTSARLEEGKNATGWKTLVDIMGADVVGKAKEWLGIQKTKDAPPPDSVVDKKDPLPLSRRFVAERYAHPEHPTLLYADDEHWAHNGTFYEIVKPDALRQQLYNFVEPFKTILVRGENETFQPFRPTSRDIDNLGDALRAVTYVPVHPPAWIGKDAWAQPDLAKLPIVPATNGVYDLTGGKLTKISDPTPRLFTTTALDYALEEQPFPPLAWLHFLADIFSDDQQQIDLLQEWFGYCLTTLTRMQKMLLLIGPKRSGKGTIARVLTSVVGPANVCAPTLAGLGTNFGLWPLVGKSVAIIGDARLSTRSDQAIVTERLLSISGEDSLTIDRKNRELLTTMLRTRIMLLSNELPKLADPSGALASRFLILHLRKSFIGNEDTGLTDKLVEERQGIAAWALQGLARLTDEWRFTSPAAADALRAELDDLASPIHAFVTDWCHVDACREVESGDLYAAWCAWCAEQGNTHPVQQNVFGRDLRAAVPTLDTRQHRDEGKRLRYYVGISLTTQAAFSAQKWRSAQAGTCAPGVHARREGDSE